MSIDFNPNFNQNEYEYEYEDEDDSNEENISLEKPSQNNSNFNGPSNLEESLSTLYSLNKFEDTGINIQNNLYSYPYQILPSPNNINKEIIDEKDEDEIENDFNNIEYQNLLNFIIYKGQINNSVIISENKKFINNIIKQTINLNINKNKKICFLVSELKKAQIFFEKYKNNPIIKAIILQKSKGKKSKNDYRTFRKQIDDNNLFIVLQNVLYKLLSIGFITIFDFGLIIFDDCHLCDSSHPYNIIMKEFYFYYYIKSQSMIKNLPNIIGFTNSPYKDKNIIKNNKKCGELLKNISENLNCQIVVDPTIFEDKQKQEEKIEFIEVINFTREKNKVDGINIILMKFFFEDMVNLCLDHYLNIKGETNELNSFNKNEIKKKYLETLKYKFSSKTFEKYNSIETSERSLHFLSKNSIMFHIFEDIQKHLFNIMQNFDLEEIYNFFEKYKILYENNLSEQKHNNNKFLLKIYKKLIFIFKVNMHAFKRLLDKNIIYETDRLRKFKNKLNEIYRYNKFNKILIFVPNRKIAYLINNYLNRDKKNNIFINKSRFLIGVNAKKEENIYLSLATRITQNEINERIKEYDENKINILICTPPAIEYLNKEKCDYIFIFSELSNSNNDYEKVKQKAKDCKAKLIIFGEGTNKLDDSLKIKKDKEFLQLKNLFMEGDIFKNPKNFRSKDFIKNKINNNDFYYYIDKTEAKMSLKNCMLLFNEINNIYLSKNIKIEISNKKIESYENEQKFECSMVFRKDGDNAIKLTSNKYNDKQTAENECFLKYIIYLHKKKLIDDHFKVIN